MNNDFIFLDYMMQRGPTGISLSETIRAIEDQQKRGLNAPASQPKSQANQNVPSTASDAGNSEEDDQDGGGIW